MKEILHQVLMDFLFGASSAMGAVVVAVIIITPILIFSYFQQKHLEKEKKQRDREIMGGDLYLEEAIKNCSWGILEHEGYFAGMTKDEKRAKKEELIAKNVR